MRFAKILVVLIASVVIAATGCVYLVPEKATRFAIESLRRHSDLERREIKLPNGLIYAYLEGGRGEPLMLLHGFGGNKDNFTKVARFLTPHYRVIIPDHIGFGESDTPPNADYAPKAQVERLRTLSNSLGINYLHFGGSSMGGHIAMTYAAMHPTEVGSLWLLDPGGVWSGPESELGKIIRETGENPLMVRTEDDFSRVFNFVMKNPPFIPRPVLNVMSNERIRNFNLEKRIFTQIVADSVEERISGSRIPALIVWGKEDRVIHFETAGILKRLIPGSNVIIMPEVGHLPMIEKPKQSAEDYLKFRSARSS